MFETKREYPAAIVDYYLDPDGSVLLATSWLAQQRNGVGGQVMLWAPGKRDITYNRRLQQLSSTAGVVTVTPRTQCNPSSQWGWRHGQRCTATSQSSSWKAPSG